MSPETRACRDSEDDWECAHLEMPFAGREHGLIRRLRSQDDARACIRVVRNFAQSPDGRGQLPVFKARCQSAHPPA